MQEKPEIEDDKIITCLKDGYGLSVESISFLPLGADLNTAVYRVETHTKTAYFLKIRRGEFNEASLAVPKFLHEQGLKQIIPALSAQNGMLWASMPPFKLILYPYVKGQHAFERKLSERQWVEFGAALKQFHSAAVPAAIANGTPREEFSARWRDRLMTFLERFEEESIAEPTAAEMATFLKSKSAETLALVKQAGQLAQKLQAQPPEFILCHADIHGWNLLIDDQGSLYLVDWDTLIFAPRERDLMFIGAGLGDSGYSSREEERLFYQGYGQTALNQMALAYYRLERIIEDIAVYCEQIFLSDEGGKDRTQALENVKSNFSPAGTIERARGSGNL